MRRREQVARGMEVLRWQCLQLLAHLLLLLLLLLPRRRRRRRTGQGLTAPFTTTLTVLTRIRLWQHLLRRPRRR